MSTGPDVSTSKQTPIPRGSMTSLASRILRRVASSGARCGPPRCRRTYRAAAISAGTRQRSSTTVRPSCSNSVVMRLVSRPGAIQRSSTTVPSVAASWTTSSLSAARRSPCRSSVSWPPPAYRTSFIASSEKNGAPSVTARAEPSVVFPAPGTPVTATSSEAVPNFCASSDLLNIGLTSDHSGGRHADRTGP